MPRPLRPKPLVVLLALLATFGGVVQAADDPGANGTTVAASPESGDASASPGPEVPRAFNVRPFELRDLGVDELSWTGEAPPPAAAHPRDR